MKIMVVGGGGREHAVIKKLKENPKAEVIYALPGNGGIAADAECVDIKATDIDSIVDFAVKNSVDFAVVTPDDPLVLGAVDALEAKGIACFGPRKNAAIIEGSKVFAKDLMKKYSIPTAAYETFDSEEAALRYLEGCDYPAVIKADGLALGKGVIIAETPDQARDAVKTIMRDKKFGKSGDRIVIEEFLTGPEVSVLAFTDSETLIPMVSSMDHKRAHDGDTGPNTGGMGTVAPNPFYTDKIAKECMETIFMPTLKAMNAEGRPFSGCLYFGLMLTPKGPRVIEYNCRFGDPETQVVLPLLKTDLLEIMLAVSQKRLKDVKVEFSGERACCVVLASRGYPNHYEKGFEIKIPSDVASHTYVAGAALREGKLVTSGGRVLGVTRTAPTLKEAVRLAYADADRIDFANAYCRRDIGKRALSAEENA